MRRVYLRLLAFVMLATVAAPLAAHAQGAPTPVVRVNENTVRELQKQKANDPAKSLADAQALVAASQAPCTVTEATSYGPFKMMADITPPGATKPQKVSVDAKLVEAVCKEQLGFYLTEAVSPGKTETIATDCLMAKAAGIPCKMPGNASPQNGMKPLLARGKSNCDPVDAAIIGENDKMRMYEVKCSTGIGQIVQVLKPVTNDSKVLAGNCLSIAEAGKPFPCKLTTEEINAAPVKLLASKATPACVPAKNRYVAGMADGSDFWEFACEGGRGIMVQATGAGEFMRAIDCGRAASIGGGCTLTDAKAAAATAAAEIATKVSAAGVKCDIAKTVTLPVRGDVEVTEFSCKNGPGGILMNKAGQEIYLNCGRAQAEGFGCAMTPKDQALAALTAQLKALGKNTCNVSNLRPLASATTAYIEVACSDGAPGFMIRYPRTSNTPTDVLTCVAAKDMSGGCQLPTNKLS